MESVEAEVVETSGPTHYIIRTTVADKKWVGKEPNSRLMLRFEGSWEFLFLSNECHFQIGDAVEIRIANALPR